MIAAKQLQMTVYASLLAALTAAGAYLAIPIGPVPLFFKIFLYFFQACY
jgi:biotin transport system substrate-specific component